ALAAVGSQAPFDKWAQLTRMLDSTIGRATLYVNGVRKAQDSAGVVPPQSNGVLRLGAGFGGTDRWTTRLSNVCLFFNALAPADVSTLHKGNAAHPHNGCCPLSPSTTSLALRSSPVPGCPRAVCYPPPSAQCAQLMLAFASTLSPGQASSSSAHASC